GRWQERKIPDYPKGTFLSIESVPSALRQIGDEEAFKKQFGSLTKRYPLVTFDKEAAMRVSQAELVTFGNPLFEAVMLWVERNLDIALKEGAVFTDPDGRRDGVLLFYQGEIRDGTNEIAGTRLFALFADRERGTLEAVNPAILWDLSEGGSLPANAPEIPVERLQSRALSALLPELEAYRQDLAQERQRQAAIKEKYGLKSLEDLIVKLDGDLIALQIRKENGENVDLVMRNKQEQKQRYEHAYEELKTTLARERQLTLSTPRFLGVARVLPAPSTAAMISDAEIEQIGMEVTMRYEREQGWAPEDVSKENLGFDVRSTSPEGQKRYIEVKARAGSGSVALTQNEWFKAKRFQSEYYLYVVLNAASQPVLYRIQNPAVTLKPEEEMEVRYLVTVKEIMEKGV
ncbi:MAG: DUF3883 domain-containing protein, partial [Anaerolineae bacterium]